MMFLPFGGAFFAQNAAKGVRGREGRKNPAKLQKRENRRLITDVPDEGFCAFVLIFFRCSDIIASCPEFLKGAAEHNVRRRRKDQGGDTVFPR